MALSPVTLFVYNRLWHVQQTVRALLNNLLAGQSELFIFSDAPKDAGQTASVEEVRRYIKTIQGFKKVTVIQRDVHFGLSRSIVSGVNEIVNRHGKIIVLEDDLATSPYFLQFMNTALSFYENEEKVISICGYMYPLSQKYEDTFFLRIADCWGWATWKRGWDFFAADGRELYNNLRTKKLFTQFNLGGAFNYIKLLKSQIQGRNDSWAVRWYASAFLNGKISLYPRQSLVMNIGLDSSGRHGGFDDYSKTKLLNEPVVVQRIPLLEEERAMLEIRAYLKKQQFNIGYNILKLLWKNKWLRTSRSYFY